MLLKLSSIVYLPAISTSLPAFSCLPCCLASRLVFSPFLRTFPPAKLSSGPESTADPGASRARNRALEVIGDTMFPAAVPTDAAGTDVQRNAGTCENSEQECGCTTCPYVHLWTPVAAVQGARLGQWCPKSTLTSPLCCQGAEG